MSELGTVKASVCTAAIDKIKEWSKVMNEAKSCCIIPLTNWFSMGLEDLDLAHAWCCLQLSLSVFLTLFLQLKKVGGGSLHVESPPS